MGLETNPGGGGSSRSTSLTKTESCNMGRYFCTGLVSRHVEVAHIALKHLLYVEQVVDVT